MKRVERIGRVYAGTYGVPRSSTLGTWIREVSAASGVPVVELAKAYRAGDGGVQSRARVYAAALQKGTRPPAGYSRTPGSKVGSYRRKTGGRWVYWYPDARHKVDRNGEPLYVAGGQGQMSLPLDRSPERVGPVHKGMTIGEVEDAIASEPIEYLVAFVDGEQVFRQQGTASSVFVGSRVLSEWEQSGEVAMTHNHPTGGMLSIEDILLCVGTDMTEIRAVTPSGDVWSMTRPETGWGRPGGLTVAEVRTMLQRATRTAMRAAALRMNEIVLAAGGDPERGMSAKGYDEKTWVEITARAKQEVYHSIWRAEGLDWTINRIRADGAVPRGDDAGRVAGAGALSAAARKGGLRAVVLLAKARPPAGYTATPGSKIGSYRKRRGNQWDYWYPPKPGSTPPQLGLFFDPVRSNPRGTNTSHPDARPAGRVATHYYSGMSQATHVAAFGAQGLPIGVAVTEIRPSSLVALRDYYAGADIPVFVDSGAFSEFSIPLKIRSKAESEGRELNPDEQKRVAKAEITAAEWEKRLDTYEKLARLLGDSAVLVAPDKVADQPETLRRMATYAEQVYDLTAFGSKILVPLQGGEMSISEFAPKAYDALGADIHRDSDVYLPAFPMNGGRLPLREIADFLKRYQPPRVHFLGIGMLSRARDAETRERVIDGLQRAVREHSPSTVITIDSNVLKSKSGKTGGAGGGPRVATIALEEARAQLLAEAGPTKRQVGDAAYLQPAMTEAVENAIGAPKWAFSRSQLRGVARRAGITTAREQGRFADNPTGYRARDARVDAQLTSELEQLAWKIYYVQPNTPETVRRQVAQVFPDVPKPPRSWWAKSWDAPPPGYSATPGSKIGSYRKRVAGKWEYWTPGQAALHARFGEGGAPVPGERKYRAAPDRGDALDGRSPVEVARTALRAAARLLDDPHLPEIIDPEWMAEWTGVAADGADRAEVIELNELAEHMAIPQKGMHGVEATSEARSDLAHEILELAMAVRERGSSAEWVSARYEDHGTLPAWAAEAVLADRLEQTSPRKMRLVLVGKEQAARFIERHHSALPYLNPRGLMYAIGIKRGDRLVAVATAGHPTGIRPGGEVDPQNVVEITRVASDGTTQGAASKLVSRLLDILPRSKRGDPNKPALLVTYQLQSESGSTYRALRKRGLRPVAVVRGEAPHGARAGSTQALSREPKIRWEAGPAAGPARWGLLDGGHQEMLFRAFEEHAGGLRKALRPSGRGWMPIPKGRRGGYRKRDGRGGWTYWYPEDHTGQSELFGAVRKMLRKPTGQIAAVLRAPISQVVEAAKRASAGKQYPSVVPFDPKKPWTSPDWAPDLATYDHILVNTSAGKDSQAMLDRMVQLADKQGVSRDKLVAIHADLGQVEWERTKTLAKQQADAYGVRFEWVQREQGDLLDQVRDRYHRLHQRLADADALRSAGVETFEALASLTKAEVAEIIGPRDEKWTRAFSSSKRAQQLVTGSRKKSGPIDFGTPVPWPSSQARYCTSDQKTSQVNKWINGNTGQAGHERVLNCLGIRAGESPARAKKAGWVEAKTDTAKRTIDQWYPIFGWTEQRVWDTIAESEVPYHTAYNKGMGRLSCVFCVFAPQKALVTAALHNPALFEKYLELEREVGYQFSANTSLADVAEIVKAQKRKLAEENGVLPTRSTSDIVASAHVSKALTQGDVDLAPLAVALNAGLAALRGNASVVVQWRDTGCCVHLRSGDDDYHIGWYEGSEANAASILAMAMSGDWGVAFEEHGQIRAQADSELTKALRPSGRGWMPIPKGRRGGYRKRDGRGGWTYWYPEDHTGQSELFAPKPEPEPEPEPEPKRKRLPTERIPELRERIAADHRARNVPIRPNSYAKQLGHWGSAVSRNPVAKTTALFGDHGHMRPLNEQMEMRRVKEMPTLTMAEALDHLDNPDTDTSVFIDSANWLAGARRYLWAQENIAKTSREDWPTLYRGMGIPKDVVAKLKVGDSLPMTGCTAMAFDRKTAEHYADSSWTKRRSAANAVGVIIEIERTDEFDSTIAGWHPHKGRSGSPAYEIVSGMNSFEVTEIIRTVSHDKLQYQNAPPALTPHGRSEARWPYDPNKPARFDADTDLLSGGERAKKRVAILADVADAIKNFRSDLLTEFAAEAKAQGLPSVLELFMRNGRTYKSATHYLDKLKADVTPKDIAQSAADHLALGRLELGWLFDNDNPRAFVRMTQEEVQAELAVRMSGDDTHDDALFWSMGGGSDLETQKTQVVSMMRDVGGYWRLEGGDLPDPAWTEGHVFTGTMLRDAIIAEYPTGPTGPTIIRGRGVLYDDSELTKALRPSGSGWMPIPKGRRGGYRKRDGRGGWNYWYPEDHTGQSELFAPKPEPRRKRLPTERIPELERTVGVSAQVEKILGRFWDVPPRTGFGLGRGLGNPRVAQSQEARVPAAAIEDAAPLYKLAERAEAVKETRRKSLVPYPPDAWLDLFENYLSTGEALDTEARKERVMIRAEYAETRAKRAEVLLAASSQQNLQAVLRQMVKTLQEVPESYWRSQIPKPMLAIVEQHGQSVGQMYLDAFLSKVEPMSAALESASASDRVEWQRALHQEIAYRSKERALYAAMWREAVGFVQKHGHAPHSDDLSAEENAKIARDYIPAMADTLIKRNRTIASTPEARGVLDHWGSADSTNKIAVAAALMGDHGIMRPRDKNLKMHRVQQTPEPGATKPVTGQGAELYLDQKTWDAGAKKYLYAQEQIQKTSREDWPMLYRGMGLLGEVIAKLEVGDSLPMTGCTAMAFNRKTAERYSESSWTEDKSPSGARPVIIELERTDEFDSTIAGWHPDRGRSGSPAYEIISGINSIEVTEIVKPVSHDKLRDERHSPAGRVGGWPTNPFLRQGSNLDTETMAGGGRARARVAKLAAAAASENAARLDWMDTLRRKLRSVGETPESRRAKKEGTKWAAKYDRMIQKVTREDMARSAADHLALGRLELGWLFDDDNPRAFVRMTREEVQAEIAVRMSGDDTHDDALFWSIDGGSDLETQKTQVVSMMRDVGGYWRLEGGDLQKNAMTEGAVFTGMDLRGVIKQEYPTGATIIRGRGVLYDDSELTKALRPSGRELLLPGSKT